MLVHINTKNKARPHARKDTFRHKVDKIVANQKVHIIIAPTEQKGYHWITARVTVAKDDRMVTVVVAGAEKSSSGTLSLGFTFKEASFMERQNEYDCGIIALRWALMHGLYGMTWDPKMMNLLGPHDCKFDYFRVMCVLALRRGYWF
jgi:hypothetical protein